jgi:hypothetical protein
MTKFDVEVVLKGSDSAVREAVTVEHGAPSTWDEGAVYDAWWKSCARLIGRRIRRRPAIVR